MRNAPRRVVTRCPRCGAPLVWSLTPFASGAQLEVTGYACHCPLSDEEWDDLAEEAADERYEDVPTTDDADAIGRVVEDDPA